VLGAGCFSCNLGTASFITLTFCSKGLSDTKRPQWCGLYVVESAYQVVFSLNSSLHFTLALSGFDFPLSDYCILPIDWFVVVSMWITSFVSGWLLCASRSVIIRWIHRRIELDVLTLDLAKHLIVCNGWSIWVFCELVNWFISSVFRYRWCVYCCVVKYCSFISWPPISWQINSSSSQQASTTDHNHTYNNYPPQYIIGGFETCFSFWFLPARRMNCGSGWLLGRWWFVSEM
jgi:hypothetical protein